MGNFSRQIIIRAAIEFAILAAILCILRIVLYDKIDLMLVNEIKGAIAQQSQSLAYSLNERFQHKLDELQTRAEQLQQNTITAESLIDVATIGTKTGRIRGILRQDKSVIAGTGLPDEVFASLERAFSGEQSISYLRDRGLLFAVPFVYEGQPCVFYELFSNEAVKHFYKVMIYNGKGTLVLATTHVNWILLSEGLYPELVMHEYPKYEAYKYIGYDEEDVSKLKNFDDTWAELEHSTLVPGKANTIFADNGIDAFFFYRTYISKKDNLVLSGYVEWDDAVVGIDHMYTFIDVIFAILMLSVAVFVGYLMRTRQAKYLEHERIVADAANQAKSNFLSSMSHEIRTPINAILGMDEMILRESKEPATLEYAENLQHAAKNLLELINDILDFSKIEAGKMEIIPVEYELCSVLNDLINMIKPRAEKKGLEFNVEADSKIPSGLYGDEIRIKQVVTNILTNAVKYTERGGVTLTVNYLPAETGSIYLCISVTDTGIGIKEEDLKKLFSAFERIEEKRNRTIEGTGLGMNITNQLLAMMGARLTVESVYGEGSNFSFQVKQRVVNPEAIGDFEQRYRNAHLHPKEYHEKFTAPDAEILVVDDTVMNLTVIKGLLKQTRIKIDTALSGKESLKLVKAKKYDIIFIDHMMPEMDGLETLRRMKEMPGNVNANTPVISLTANAISGAREQYLEAGFNDYLTKPINFEQLETLIAKYLPEEKVIPSTGVEDKKPEGEPERELEMPVDILPTWLTTNEEIKVTEGIEHCGSIENYLDILKVFVNAIPVNSKEIEGYFKEKDWHNYTTKVHALKSTAGIIGAEELSKFARKLEEAGKANRIGEIEQEHRSLMEMYLSYLEMLRPLVKEERYETAKPLISEDALAEAFMAIKEIATTFDYESLTFVIESLDEYRLPEREAARFKQIKEAAAKLEWTRINDLLKDVE